jgi:hypothetical protein
MSVPIQGTGACLDMSRLVVANQKAHRQTDTGSKVILFYISNIKVILSRPYGLIRLFIVYLSYLNIDKLLQIKFVKKFAESK